MEEVDPEVWSWWWPLSALGGAIGLISVVGIIAYQQLISRSPGHREQARRFSMLLQRRGFRTGVRDFNYSSLVDFEDPELRRTMIRVGAPYDRKKAEDFAFGIIGSVEFVGSPGLMPGAGGVTMSGDLPVAIMRKPMARGAWRERIEIPPDIKVIELHWHTVDGIPTTHVHVSGIDVHLEELARFVGELRDISKGFVLAG